MDLLLKGKNRPSDDLQKTEDSLARDTGITGYFDETDDDAYRIRRGPRWLWEIYLQAAILVLVGSRVDAGEVIRVQRAICVGVYKTSSRIYIVRQAMVSRFIFISDAIERILSVVLTLRLKTTAHDGGWKTVTSGIYIGKENGAAPCGLERYYI